jgi:predicted extracellular nuclease
MKRTTILTLWFLLAALLVLTAACGTANVDDDDDDGGAAGDPAVPVKVFDLQQGRVPVDTRVKLTEVVVTTPLTAEGTAFFVQEPEGGPYSGIYVYMYRNVAEGVRVAIGDVITLFGDYSEFYDFSELTVTSISDIQVLDWVAEPEPVDVDAAELGMTDTDAEPYEGVLVRLTDVAVTEEANHWGEFVVEDNVRVDDRFYGQRHAPAPPLGTDFDELIGVVDFNYDEYKLCPRRAADYQSNDWQADEPPLPGTGDDIEIVSATIYEVQQGDYEPGDLVTIEAIVTSPLIAKGDTMFIQEEPGGEYSGVALYLYDEVQAEYVAEVGDRVRVTGEITEYFDFTEITVRSPYDFQILESGEVPDPDVIEPGDIGEPWEGVLVQINDVTVETEVNGFGEFTGKSGGETFTVDDIFFSPYHFEDIPVLLGDEFNWVRGVIFYSFEEYKFEPRTDNDLQQ